MNDTKIVNESENVELSFVTPDSIYQVEERGLKSLKKNPFNEAESFSDAPEIKSIGEELNFKPVVPRLRFRINGIIESETNKVIILEDLDENKIVYLKKGEKYKKLKVKYILTNTVLLLNEGVEENYEINK